MKQKRIAIANMKGGVGKSTTTMMLADTLSLHHDLRVLVVDCDPQSNSSQMILSFPGLKSAKSAHRTITSWVGSFCGTSWGDGGSQEQRDIWSTISANVSGLAELKIDKSGRSKKKQGQVSVWAATPRLRFAELAFDHLFFEAGDTASPRTAMKNHLIGALNRVREEYDVVLFDCPPGFSTLAQAALCISDIIVSPLNVDRVALWSLKTFWEQGLSETLSLNSDVEKWALLTMVQNGRGALREKTAVRADLRAFAGDAIFDDEIPYSVQALRFVRRPDVDSYQRFNAKYGRLAKPVQSLGKSIVQQISEKHIQ